MLVVRRLSAGVRGSCWCGQGQQKGARRLSSSTLDSSKKVVSGAAFWDRQWEKAKEAAPVLLGFLGVGAVIWEGSRQIEKMRGEMATREAVVHGELTKREVELRAELEKKEGGLRAEVAKQQAEWEKREVALRAELARQEAEMRGQREKGEEKLRGEMNEKYELLRGDVKERDAIRGGEVDRRVLDLLTRGDYDRARVLLEERSNARLSSSPRPPPST